MSSTTEKPKAMDADQTPFLSDDELSRLSYTQDTTPPDSYGDGWDCSNQEQNWFDGAKYTRDRYEAELSRLRGLLDEARRLVMLANDDELNSQWHTDAESFLAKLQPTK